MSMPNRIDGPGLSHQFRIVDAHGIDGEALLASSQVEDHIVAILADLRDRHDAVRRILKRIERCEPERRDRAVKVLEILAGLRSLAEFTTKEAKAMPILQDILDHATIGPRIREGIAIGRKEGLEDERRLVRRLIEKRFGDLPRAFASRLENLSVPELEAIGLRLLDVSSLDELFA